MEELKEKIDKLYKRIDDGVDYLYKSHGEQEEINSQIKQIKESVKNTRDLREILIEIDGEVFKIRDIKQILDDGFTEIRNHNMIIGTSVVEMERSSIVSLEQTTISQLLQIKHMHATGALTDEDAILSSKNCMQILIERLNKYQADLKPRQETIDMYKRFVKVYKSTKTNEIIR